jgi:hypothetical protein
MSACGKPEFECRYQHPLASKKANRLESWAAFLTEGADSGKVVPLSRRLMG